MEPCIEAYNHISRVERMGPVRTWEKIKAIIPNFIPECDIEKYHTLFFLLLDKGKLLKKEDIYIGLNHDQMIAFMEEFKEHKINLYNIDHHHDMGYEGNNGAFDSLGVANWVHFANKDMKLSSYTWIHNVNSIYPTEELCEQYKRYTHTTDINILNNIQFDKIFLCASWEWVPLKYEPLFDILVSAIDKR